jgi:uncharacterized protein YmfQ (DUF2313 family)
MYEKFRLYAKYTVADYLSMLKSLLPRGPIWGFFFSESSSDFWQDTISGDEIQDTHNSTEIIQDIVDGVGDVTANTKFGLLLACFASELTRFEQRYWDVSNEAVPGLAVELLPEWNAQLGISVGSRSTEEQQAEAHAKATSEHEVTTDQYFIDYAEKLGFVIEITQGGSEPRRMGVARMGIDPRMGGTGQNNAWHITVVSGTGNLNQLQEVFQTIKQAHKVIVWTIL